MTFNWNFRSRNGISIPKNPQNGYLNLSEMFSEGIIEKLEQKLIPKTAISRKSKFLKNVHLNEKWLLIQFLGTLYEFKSAAIPLVTFWSYFLFPIDICISLKRHFHPKMLYENKKSHFTAKRHILEKNVISTTPPFEAILPTRDL